MERFPYPQQILAFIDAPDPDNFVMLLALARRFPTADLHVILTGRPIRLNANRQTPVWDWDTVSSRKAQEASAARAKNFMKWFGVRIPRIYDGGIAPRTLVPHHVHFAEYYQFNDLDWLDATRFSELEPMEDLIKEVLKWDDRSTAVVVGGPMTGLNQMITRCPEVVSRFAEIHAMFATWGNVTLMDMGAPRGAKQFNVACDPQAAYNILMGMTCPIYLMPTEVTRVAEIGFQNAQELKNALPTTQGVRALYNLYALWYDAAVKPRQDKDPNEKIFIHDVVGSFSLDPELRQSIYEIVPVEISSVPHLPKDTKDWGEVKMRKTDQPTNVFAATRIIEGGAEKYLKALYNLFV